MLQGNALLHTLLNQHGGAACIHTTAPDIQHLRLLLATAHSITACQVVLYKGAYTRYHTVPQYLQCMRTNCISHAHATLRRPLTPRGPTMTRQRRDLTQYSDEQT